MEAMITDTIGPILVTILVGFILVFTFKTFFGHKDRRVKLDSSELREPPRRTFLIRLGDRWLRMLRRCCGRRRVDDFLSISLTEECLTAAAMRETGLKDFGDAYRQHSRIMFNELLKSLESEAKLSPVGQICAAYRCRSALTNRLRAVELLRRHPEILDQEIDDPIIVTGLPRTGTTLVHRLLALNPTLRCLPLWEALNPAPHPDYDPERSARAYAAFLASREEEAQEAEKTVKRKKKCSGPWVWMGQKMFKLAKQFLKSKKEEEGSDQLDPRLDEANMYAFIFHYVAPNAFTIHPCELEAPEEEAVVMDIAFMSQLSEALYCCPTFASFLEKQDPLPMYECLKTMMKLLQWQRPGLGKPCRWILKSPNHLEWLDTVFKVFPKAQIVVTHRDTVECLTSAFSASCHARRLFSDDVDPVEVAQHWLKKDVHMLERGFEARRKLESEDKSSQADKKESFDEKEVSTSEEHGKVRQEDSTPTVATTTSALTSSVSKKFIDVEYQDFMKNPIQALQEIYSFAGLEWTKESEKIVNDYLKHEHAAGGGKGHGKSAEAAKSSKSDVEDSNVHAKKYGKHEYRLSDFGLTRDQILSHDIFQRSRQMARS